MTAPRAPERWIPRVAGSNRPAAWGHRFGPSLRCDHCGVGWLDHAKDPHGCSVEATKPWREVRASSARAPVLPPASGDPFVREPASSP
jgi:hypothetical protein